MYLLRIQRQKNLSECIRFDSIADSPPSLFVVGFRQSSRFIRTSRIAVYRQHRSRRIGFVTDQPVRSSEPHFHRHFVSLSLFSFHLDHCGALPWFLNRTNFKGRCFMTHATKVIYKLLLADCIRVGSVVPRCSFVNRFVRSSVQQCQRRRNALHRSRTERQHASDRRD